MDTNMQAQVMLKFIAGLDGRGYAYVDGKIRRKAGYEPMPQALDEWIVECFGEGVSNVKDLLPGRGKNGQR